MMLIRTVRRVPLLMSAMLRCVIEASTARTHAAKRAIRKRLKPPAQPDTALATYRTHSGHCSHATSTYAALDSTAPTAATAIGVRRPICVTMIGG